jgi:hypothetical protein
MSFSQSFSILLSAPFTLLEILREGLLHGRLELGIADGAVVVRVSFRQELIPEVCVVKGATLAGEKVVKVIKS